MIYNCVPVKAGQAADSVLVKPPGLRVLELTIRVVIGTRFTTETRRARSSTEKRKKENYGQD